MKPLLALAALAALLLTPALRAQDPTADAAKLPTNIETVVSGGYWENGGQDGNYRVVILLEGWEHLANRVLLQWIRHAPDKQDLVLEKTVAITEIPQGAAWRIISAKFVTPKDKPAKDSKSPAKLAPPQLVLQAVSERAGKATFTITPTNDHQYKFSQSLK